MRVGQRIIFDKITGTILNGSLEERIDTGMTTELLKRIRPANIDYIDLEWGGLDNKILISVNPVTKELITKDIIHIETEEEILRREKEELENQLLLQIDENIGGVL